jgi:hypothetical protein
MFGFRKGLVDVHFDDGAHPITYEIELSGLKNRISVAIAKKSTLSTEEVLDILNGEM